VKLAWCNFFSHDHFSLFQGKSPCAVLRKHQKWHICSQTKQIICVSFHITRRLWSREIKFAGKCIRRFKRRPFVGKLIKVIRSYFSPCSVSFVLSGEYIQYSPLINFRLIIPSNIHLQLIIPSNIHLQCLCSTKNEKKTTSRRQFGIENYFYSESLTQPRSVKNKYVILRHLGDMCLFTSALRASRLFPRDYFLRDYFHVTQWRSQLDNWGGGVSIFIYSCSALLISFEIDCF
jgi:hypothetical protein